MGTASKWISYYFCVTSKPFLVTKAFKSLNIYLSLNCINKSVYNNKHRCEYNFLFDSPLPKKGKAQKSQCQQESRKKIKKNKHCSVICLLYISLKAVEHLCCDTVFTFLCLLFLYTSTHFINLHVLKNTQQNINNTNSLQHWSILSCPLTSPLTSEQLSLQK